MIKLKETSKGVILKIRVSPGRSAFGIRGFDSWSSSLLLTAGEPPEKGKANKEIERELSVIFGKPVWITSGRKSRNKTVIVQGSKSEILRALEQLIV